MRRTTAFTVLVFVLCSSAWGAETPVAVSPGDSLKIAMIGDTCPTFSWGAIEGAKAYELVIYRLGVEGEEAKPALRQRFQGAVTSWTPSLDSCLVRGEQYGWSVRGVTGKKASEWSAPGLFQVAAGPSEREFEEAVQVVRAYLGAQQQGAASVPEESRSSGPAESPASRQPPAPPTTAGDFQVAVDGNVDVTGTMSANDFTCDNCLGSGDLASDSVGSSEIVDDSVFPYHLKLAPVFYSISATTTTEQCSGTTLRNSCALRAVQWVGTNSSGTNKWCRVEQPTVGSWRICARSEPATTVTCEMYCF